ncbi:hypothetical protein M9H77_13394 [Catharanthus roseus]|uniref:Uncharacterized protein n=1 Tax=Catharanthus roseus TaxID=4058 RepID=A0ACC0BK34_CATRO|nr:hypothetical protein M9H77_13394 [Catharanthus roseus]
MGTKRKQDEILDDEEEEQQSSASKSLSTSKKKKAQEHMKQLQRLQEKDPNFCELLKEHDQELLEFNDEDIGVSLSLSLCFAMVDSWYKSIRESTSLGAVRSVMRAFRTACHYGDDAGD